MGLIFHDYDGLQPKITPPKHFSRECMWKERKKKVQVTLTFCLGCLRCVSRIFFVAIQKRKILVVCISKIDFLRFLFYYGFQ